ncbi:hypothetical protein V6R21_08580 [Limibacter armeniacum]|uniref:YdeI/OmpD-associated family protein n=1 Tax=Limibacter armeniacum TaxID=466084 RepID=UPI002FE5A15C
MKGSYTKPLTLWYLDLIKGYYSLINNYVLIAVIPLTIDKKTMTATFFASPEEFRKWLKQHHQSETALIVGFYKIKSGKPSMTWSQSVDQALCFGWVDGVRKSIDKDSYCIRFTPRKQNSTWSTVNINKVEESLAKQD